MLRETQEQIQKEEDSRVQENLEQGMAHCTVIHNRSRIGYSVPHNSVEPPDTKDSRGSLHGVRQR